MIENPEDLKYPTDQVVLKVLFEQPFRYNTQRLVYLAVVKDVWADYDGFLSNNSNSSNQNENQVKFAGDLKPGDVVLVFDEPTLFWSSIFRFFNASTNSFESLENPVEEWFPTFLLRAFRVQAMKQNGEITYNCQLFIFDVYYRFNLNSTCAACNDPEKAHLIHMLDVGDFVKRTFYCSDCWNKPEIQEKVHSTLKENERFVHKYKRHEELNHFLIVEESVALTLKNSFLANADKPCLGMRKKLPGISEFENKFSFISYSEMYGKVIRFCSGLKKIFEEIKQRDQPPEIEEEAKQSFSKLRRKKNFVGVCGPNCIDWFVADFGAILIDYVSVPLPKEKIKERDQIVAIINNAEIAILISSAQTTPYFMEMMNCQGKNLIPSVKLLIEMDDYWFSDPDECQKFRTEFPLTETAKEEFNMKYPNIDFYHMFDIQKIGNSCKLTELDSPVDDLLTLTYTSGSTGIPKGAMMTNKKWLKAIKAKYITYHPLVSMSFSPLSHITDRMNVHTCLVSGGRVGCACGNMERIFEDFQLLSPSLLSSTPRLFNQIYQEYQNALQSLRIQNLEEKEFEAQESLLLKKFSQILGGRMKAMTTGGAPTSKEVFQFLQRCFKIPIAEGYASTEGGSIFWIQGVKQGPIDQNVEIKLVSVPEMNYFVTDKPNPRGEMYVKSPDVFVGYYNNPDATDQAFTEDGFYKTGDIGVQYPDGTYGFVDRKSNIFKLAQGEFVSPEKLELIYGSNCRFVEQIIILGNSEKSFVVAIVVLKLDSVKNWLLQNSENFNQEFLEIFGQNEGIFENLEEILSNNPEIFERFEKFVNKYLKKEILREFHKLGKERHLPNYEIPKNILLEIGISEKKFTTENGLLTPSFKVSRFSIKKKYSEKLEKLYADVDKNLESTIFEILGKNENFDENLTFSELGTDSLSAVKLTSFLKDLGFENANPSMFLSKDLSIKDAFKRLQNSQSQQSSEVSIDVEKEIESSIQKIESYETDIKSAFEGQEDQDCLSILLTGATGFIGSVLLGKILEFSEQISQNFKRKKLNIFCILRSNASSGNIEDRMLDIMKKAKLSEIYSANRQKIVLLEGDISQPFLGVQKENWEMLCKKIDIVFAAGAMVDHQRPYTVMKSSNVESLVEIMKLCISSTKKKVLHYFSSISVAQQLSTPKLFEEKFVHELVENEDLKKLITENHENMRLFQHCGGYTQTKAIGEMLLREYFSKPRRTNFEYVIWRPPMTLFDTRSGFCNTTDWVNRFFIGCLKSKLAPKFMSTSAKRMSHLIGGAPVDHISESIVKLTLLSSSIDKNGGTFNIQNKNCYLDAEKLLKTMQNQSKNQLKFLDYEDWVEKMKILLEQSSKNSKNDANPILAVMMNFENTFPGEKQEVNSENFEEIQKKIDLADTGADMQRNDYENEEILKKYYDYLIDQKSV